MPADTRRRATSCSSSRWPIRPCPNEKVPTYGKAGIPETWLVDLAAETVTLYTDPGRDGYTREQLYRRGDAIVATGAPEIALQVDEMFA